MSFCTWQIAPCEDQLLLVDLISAIKVLPTDTLVQTITKVLKQPPQTEIGRNKVILSYHKQR